MYMSTHKEQSPQRTAVNAEQLGIQPNIYLNHPRWARILLDDSIEGFWVPTSSRKAIGKRTVTVWHDDNANWGHDQIRNIDLVQEGYIGGFPEIVNTETDEKIECLHMWYNNADITPDEKAFPVRAIRAALLTTHRESKLRIHADNLEMEGVLSDRYIVPVLLDQNGEQQLSIFGRKASASDVLSAVTSLQYPLYYFGPTQIPEEIKEREPGKVLGFVGLEGQSRRSIIMGDLSPQETRAKLDIS